MRPPTDALVFGRWTRAELAVLIGGGVGLLFGVAQFFVLRRLDADAGHWLWDNALGWGLGLPAMYAAGIFGAEDPSTAAALGLAAATTIIVGLGVSFSTWVALGRLRKSQ